MPDKLKMRIRGWRLIGETWPYLQHGNWPYYRSGIMLDSKLALAGRMQLKPWGFIQLAEGIKN